MSTTTGADTALDLNAIEARARSIVSANKWLTKVTEQDVPALIAEVRHLAVRSVTEADTARDERGKLAGFYHFMEPEYGSSKFGFPADPEPDQDFTADDGSKWRFANLGQPMWDLVAYAPEPDPHAECRPAARVITGDIPTVTAALDALPAGTVIRIVEEEDGPQVFEAVVAHGHYAPPIVWSSTRSPRLVDSGYIARGETPVTVLWAGETA